MKERPLAVGVNYCMKQLNTVFSYPVAMIGPKVPVFGIKLYSQDYLITVLHACLHTSSNLKCLHDNLTPTPPLQTNKIIKQKQHFMRQCFRHWSYCAQAYTLVSAVNNNVLNYVHLTVKNINKQVSYKKHFWLLTNFSSNKIQNITFTMFVRHV